MGQKQAQLGKAIRLVLHQHRHEGLIERTFSKQATEEVRNTKCNEEQVSSGRCTKQVGKHHITYQTANSRQKRHASHRTDASIQRRLIRLIV